MGWSLFTPNGNHAKTADLGEYFKSGGGDTAVNQSTFANASVHTTSSDLGRPTGRRPYRGSVEGGARELSISEKRT